MATVLKLNDSGPAVKKLQRALKDKGFSPGSIDGEFGSGTEQALLAFQRSEGLLADAVAGPRTLARLGLVTDASLPDASGGMTVQIASRMCPGAQLDNIKQHLPVLLASLQAHALADRSMVLMAVATIRAETSSFLPISEGRSKFNTSPGGQPFDLYDFRADLGNQGVGDGAQFCGRGFVQLTGRHNYQRYGQRLGLDLINQPQLANSSKVAADLLSVFLGDRELNIKDALMHGNFAAARRLVNGGSHGLAEFTDAYKTGDALLV